MDAGFRTDIRTSSGNRIAWEGEPKSVRVTYVKPQGAGQDPEYREARETSWEDGGTTLQA